MVRTAQSCELRDVPVTLKLAELIPTVAQLRRERVVVMSHRWDSFRISLMRIYPQQLHLIDLCGLADLALTSLCRRESGTEINEGAAHQVQLSVRRPELPSACRLPQPDIIVDRELGGERVLNRGDMLRRYGSDRL